VAAEHVSLVAANGMVRLATGGTATGETYLNDSPADDGFVVRSGDILRLGADGPELRIRLIERKPEPEAEVYEPTRVLRQPTQVIQTPISASHEPTRVMSVPPAGNGAASPGGGAGRYGYAETVQGSAPAGSVPPPRATTVVTPRSADTGPNYAGATVGAFPARVQEPKMQAAPPPPQARGIDSESLRVLEGRLKGMRTILLANLAILAVLLLWILQLNNQLSQNRDELRALRTQAQTAMGQFTPALDARLNVFEQRMDGIDDKMKVAQDRMTSGMDSKMKQAEDRMVARMNAEIPAMLEKYINHKLAELKH
jgi:hypothetical protein